jgi:hypothetical protein
MLEAFGALAAASMVACHALGERGPGFTLGFAAGCGATTAYAFAIGSWPFFILEALWAAIADRRGLRRLATGSGPSDDREKTR